MSFLSSRRWILDSRIPMGVRGELRRCRGGDRGEGGTKSSRGSFAGRLGAIQFALQAKLLVVSWKGGGGGRTESLDGPDESDLRRGTSTSLDLLDDIVQDGTDVRDTRSSSYQ